jgi:hypothetical protein
VKVRSTRIAVSAPKNGGLVLGGSGRCFTNRLGEASIALSLKAGTTLGYRVVANKSLVPLIELSQFQSFAAGPPQFAFESIPEVGKWRES